MRVGRRWAGEHHQKGTGEGMLQGRSLRLFKPQLRGAVAICSTLKSSLPSERDWLIYCNAFCHKAYHFRQGKQATGVLLDAAIKSIARAMTNDAA